MKDFKTLKEESNELKSGLGAVAWATLEMFRQGGMSEDETKLIHDKMNQYFANPTNETCNVILQVVEERLQEDKKAENIWY